METAPYIQKSISDNIWPQSNYSGRHLALSIVGIPTLSLLKNECCQILKCWRLPSAKQTTNVCMYFEESMGSLQRAPCLWVGLCMWNCCTFWNMHRFAMDIMCTCWISANLALLWLNACLFFLSITLCCTKELHLFRWEAILEFLSFFLFFFFWNSFFLEYYLQTGLATGGGKTLTTVFRKDRVTRKVVQIFGNQQKLWVKGLNGDCKYVAFAPAPTTGLQPWQELTIKDLPTLLWFGHMALLLFV